MRWRTLTGHAARRGGGRARAAVTLVTVAALSGTLTLPARAAPPAADGPAVPYAFARDVRTVEGAEDTMDAVRLDPGRTYRSTLPAAGKRYYRLELDAASSAYVSATAVPGAGAQVTSSDGLKVSVQDADGTTCSTGTTHIGPTQSPHPIAAWASRETGPGHYVCKGAGVYYVVVERRVPAGETSADDWYLELAPVSEPALREADTTAPPGAWESATPEPVLGDAAPREGGAGFADAAALGQGVWRDAVKPGQTLFYKVPVDWGRRLSATVEMGSSPGGDGYVGTALAVSLYNPARARVDDAGAGYSGAQTSASLRPLPPVDYANRHAVGDRTSAMRFAGWYYLAVHLGTPVGERFGEGPFGLTLRVRVSGTPVSGPAYAGRSAPRDVFEVTAEDREAAAPDGAGNGDGSAGPGAGSADDAAGSGGEGGEAGAVGPERDGTRTLTLVAVGGIGTGSALLLWLGLWTVVAWRRARGRWAGTG